MMGENSGGAGLDAGFAEALEFDGQKDVPVLLDLEVQPFGGTNLSNGSGRHGAEKVRGEADEGFDGGGGGGEIGEGVGGGHGEDRAAGAEGGFDAGVGVLDDEAVGGRESEFFGGEEKNVGCGFSIHDIVAADDGVEIFVETGGGENGFQIFARRGGGDGAGDFFVTQGGEEFAGAGEDVDAGLADEVAVDRFLAVGESVHFGGVGGPAEDVGDDDLVFFAEAFFEMAFGERTRDFGGEEFPGAFVLRGGIDDDAAMVMREGSSISRAASRTSSAVTARRRSWTSSGSTTVSWARIEPPSRMFWLEVRSSDMRLEPIE